MKLITIKTDGSCDLIEESWGLDEYNKFVDGWIEFVDIGDLGSLIINEEGKLLGFDINDVATKLMNIFSRYPFADVIVGNAILVGPTDENGDTTSVTEDTINIFRNADLL